MFIYGVNIYYFYGSSINKGNTSSNVTLGSVSFAKIYKGMVVTPNFVTAMMWDSNGGITVYNLSNMSIITTFSLPNYFYPHAISISFSSNSLLAVIETDAANPVSIYSLANQTIINTLSIDDIITSAFFLEQTSTKIIILGQK